MPIKIIKNQEHIFVFSHKNAYCIGDCKQKSYTDIENILFCILKQRVASYMQKQNITMRLFIIILNILDLKI